MKEHVYLTVVLLTLLATSTFAEEAKVKVISTIPAAVNVKVGWDVNISVFQIQDQKNGVVCYGLAPTSNAGRTTDAGYPGTSISCVQTPVSKKE